MLHSILKVARATSSKEVKDLLRLTSTVESRMKSVAKLSKQLGKAEPSKAKSLWDKVVNDASSAIDASVKLHKKISGTSEFAALGKSIVEVETALGGKDFKASLPAFQAAQVLKSLERLYGDCLRVSTLAKSGYLE